jgi:hypothetical protein
MTMTVEQAEAALLVACRARAEKRLEARRRAQRYYALQDQIDALAKERDALSCVAFDSDDNAYFTLIDLIDAYGAALEAKRTEAEAAIVAVALNAV